MKKVKFNKYSLLLLLVIGIFAVYVISNIDLKQTGKVVSETQTVTIKNTSYVYAHGLAASYDSEGKEKYYINDHLGGTGVVIDKSGNVVASDEYLAFGEEKAAVGDEKFTYTGKELDDTGFYYYGARYYDADTGRFTQPDPLIGGIKNPQSLNRYAYTLNNPLKYTDPSGMDENDVQEPATSKSLPIIRQNPILDTRELAQERDIGKRGTIWIAAHELAHATAARIVGVGVNSINVNPWFSEDEPGAHVTVDRDKPGLDQALIDVAPQLMNIYTMKSNDKFINEIYSGLSFNSKDEGAKTTISMDINYPVDLTQTLELVSFSLFGETDTKNYEYSAGKTLSLVTKAVFLGIATENLVSNIKKIKSSDESRKKANDKFFFGIKVTKRF